MVESLWHRGSSRQSVSPQDSFEPFIYTWIAFNAWAECVSAKDTDTQWVRALASDDTLTQRFQDLIDTPDSAIARSLTDFSQFWPIPKVQAMRRRRPNNNLLSQEERARFYSDNRIEMQPKCWLVHHERGEPVPTNWPHFLHATYRVRCNLFHGEKSPYDLVDQTIVSAAFHTLVLFLKNCDEFTPAREMHNRV